MPFERPFFLRDAPGDPTVLRPRYEGQLRQAQALTGADLLLALGALGQLARSLSDYPAAIGHFAEAVALARTLGDEPRGDANLVRLGVALHHAGDLAPAIDCFEQVLEAPNRGYHDFALQHLAKLEVERGAYRQAAWHLAQALELRLAQGDAELIASTREAQRALASLRSAAEAQ